MAPGDSALRIRASAISAAAPSPCTRAGSTITRPFGGCGNKGGRQDAGCAAATAVEKRRLRLSVTAISITALATNNLASDGGGQGLPRDSSSACTTR